MVDLPGIYSLSPYSMEEIVARDFIIQEAPDCIIDIVDATNIERNLYLTVQLLELERPTVVALNFMDEVAQRGDRIDVERLSKELGVPVVPITARTGEGLEELLHTAHRQMHLGFTIEPDDLYDDYTTISITGSARSSTTTPMPPTCPPTGPPSSCWRGTRWWRGRWICLRRCGTGCAGSRRSTRAPATWATGRLWWRTAGTSTSKKWWPPRWSRGNRRGRRPSRRRSTGWSPTGYSPSPCFYAPCW